ncbi:hypothetical protein CLV58_109124 [Spirosoma oryzae]|uniref:Uncharacterized protein n=1 Tax=Spirosoma oryzae TaxID=1469603 RepID=A0A2T0SYB0_9BACT|nr:hypothetical protein [Spirosoma oryzae]PRY38397.1 hypothetical protein CLV58_109124 [Spirosoma oryzae]
MNSDQYISVKQNEAVTVLEFNRSLFARREALDLLPDQLKGKTVRMEIDLTTQTFESCLDNASVVQELLDEQLKKVTDMEERTQNARNKAIALKLLRDQLTQKSEDLAPMKTIYLIANPGFSQNLNRELAQGLIDSGYWTDSLDKVTEVDLVSLGLEPMLLAA